MTSGSSFKAHWAPAVCQALYVDPMASAFLQLYAQWEKSKHQIRNSKIWAERRKQRRESPQERREGESREVCKWKPRGEGGSPEKVTIGQELRRQSCGRAQAQAPVLAPPARTCAVVLRGPASPCACERPRITGCSPLGASASPARAFALIPQDPNQ